MDPADKLLEVSRYGVTLSLEAARAEASKCVLLCSNCHAEVERGVSRVPARVAPARESPDINVPDSSTDYSGVAQ
jgi:hypothetical protein